MKQEDIDFWAGVKPWMERVFKLKKKMLEKGLRKAKATCEPPCKGFIVGYLAGPKNHIHARCIECKLSLME